MDRVLTKVWQRHARVVNELFLFALICSLVLTFHPAALPKVIFSIAGVMLGLSLLFGLGIMFYWVIRYAREDPDLSKEKAPSWRVTLLALLLMVALASPWWVGRIFH